MKNIQPYRCQESENKEDTIFHANGGHKLKMITSNEGKDHSQSFLAGI